MKTAELTGAALDWAVAMSLKQSGEDYTLAVDADIDGTKRVNYGGMYPEWSTDWAEGGAIIEREGMQLWKGGEWCAALDQSFNPTDFQTGTTPLVAAMRCYVASKLGDKVEIPEELLCCAHD
jgi:hypothetical protein